MNMHDSTASRAGRLVRSSDHVPIAYEVIGDGIPVVCLHGFSESGASWREAGYVDSLTARGFRLVLIDSRGHGQSGKPHDPGAYRGSLRLADLFAVLDTLGLNRVRLLGHSMGGVAALAAAALFPQRIAAAAVIGAHPHAEDLSPLRRLLDDGLGGWIAHVESQIGGLSDATRQRLGANDIQALRACISRDRPGFSSALEENRVPILAVAGSEDPRRPGIEAMGRLPGIAVRVVSGRNHITAFSDSGTVLGPLLSFFNQTGHEV